MRTNNPFSCKAWKVTHFAVISFELLLNTICNTFTLVIHSINKQKSNKRYSQLMFLQCSQHIVLFLYCVVFPLFWPSPVCVQLLCQNLILVYKLICLGWGLISRGCMSVTFQLCNYKACSWLQKNKEGIVEVKCCFTWEFSLV
jgi:hypothetical protein